MDFIMKYYGLTLTLIILAGCMELPGVDTDVDQSPSPPESESVGLKATAKGIKTAAESWWHDLQTYPHASDSLADWTQYQWRNQLNIVKDSSPSLMRAVERAGGKLHNWNEGNGYLVTDFHGVEVKLPDGDNRKSAHALLALLRDNPAMVGGGPTITDFNDEVTWPSTTQGRARQPGDVVFLDLWGPDNAAIVYIDTDLSDGQFCVMTATHAQTGWHPVNGVRCWGYIKWQRDGFTHLFYTTGVDSSTTAGSGWVGGSLQFEVWGAQMAAVSRHVECIWGGDAGYMWQDDEVQEWLNTAPGRVGINDVDHLGAWDAYSEASGQYEYDCRHSELIVSEGSRAPQPSDSRDGSLDTDKDGITDAFDLCSGTPSGAAVWKEGAWIGCAGGQKRDR
jgi:hypothetical protein